MEINNLSSAQRSAPLPPEARPRTADVRAQDTNRSQDTQPESTPRASAAPDTPVSEQSTPQAPPPRGSIVDIAV